MWAATVASLASLVGRSVAAELWIAALGAVAAGSLIMVLRTRRGPGGNGRHVARLG